MSQQPILSNLVQRRTFAANHAKSPDERDRLNRDSITSEHTPERPFLVRERAPGGRSYNHCFMSLNDARP